MVSTFFGPNDACCILGARLIAVAPLIPIKVASTDAVEWSATDGSSLRGFAKTNLDSGSVAAR